MFRIFITSLFLAWCCLATCVGLIAGINDLDRTPRVAQVKRDSKMPFRAMLEQARYRGEWAGAHGLPAQRNPYRNQSVYVNKQDVSKHLANAWQSGWLKGVAIKTKNK